MALQKETHFKYLVVVRPRGPLKPQHLLEQTSSDVAASSHLSPTSPQSCQNSRDRKKWRQDELVKRQKETTEKKEKAKLH